MSVSLRAIIKETSTSNRLVLTSNETGTANSISPTFTGTLGTDLGLIDINNPAQPTPR